MTHVVTAEKDGMFRIESAGASATVKLYGELAQLLFLQVPVERRRQGEGKALLQTVENEAAAYGAKKLFLDYSENEQEIAALVKSEGFLVSSTGPILSVSISELLSSLGVQKSLRMKFPDIRILKADDILFYEWEDITEFLNKCHFPMQEGDLGRYDLSLSFVSYDKGNRPKAVLLSSIQGKKLVVELLLGFSKTMPQYILSVCQGFANALNEEAGKRKLDRMYIYSCTENVVPLIRRLLDKQYELHTETDVKHAEKELACGTDHIERDAGSGKEILLWQKEADAVFGQRNITDKAVWLAKRN